MDGNGVETPATPNPLLPADLEGDRWIQVQVDGSAPLSPPVALGAVPHAISAASATAIFDPSTNAALNLAALDGRWVGSVGGTTPDASGNFNLARGFGTTLTPTPNGVTISASTSDLDTRYIAGTLAQLDGRYVLNNPGGVITTGVLNSAQVFTNELQANSFQLRGSAEIWGEVRGASFGGNLTLNAGNPFGDVRITDDLVVTGNLSVQGGGAKSFVIDHPNDATKEIVYCSLEGPECAIYARGSSQLSAGTKQVDLPEHFAALAAPGSITVTVTPTGNCKGLYVESKAVDKIVVRELGNSTNSTVTFDYMAYAVRKGQESFQPVRPKPN